MRIDGRATGAGRPRHRSRGVVMIVTLLAVVLLLALILYVLNLGEQVNRRQEAQDVADSTAMAGATWVARQLNIVSENNMTMARNIALINGLDSMEQATDYTLREHTAITAAMQRLNASGTLNNGVSVLNDHLVDTFDAWQDEMENELVQLQDMYTVYAQVAIEEMTYYNAPSGENGAIWRAMFAMDELSQVTMENLGDTAQTMAVTGGGHSMRDAALSETMMVPVMPEFPWERGHFNDLEWPVKFGVLPGAAPYVNDQGVIENMPTTPAATMAIDDPIERRGPFDTLFGYHYLVRECPWGQLPIPGGRVLSGGGGAIPLGSGEGVRRYCPDPGWQVVGYKTYGTHAALNSGNYVLRYDEEVGWYDDERDYRGPIGLISRYVTGNMRNTRLDDYAGAMADAKLRYLWPDPNDQGVVIPAGQVVPLQRVIDPEWITDFNTAVQRAATREGRREIQETAYFVYEIKSLYPPNHGSFMSDGTWAPVHDSGQRQPRMNWRRGWVNPLSWDRRPGVQRIHPYGWMDEYAIEVAYDADLGITPSFDEDGQPIPVTIYRVDSFYFAGINVGEQEDVPNCYAGFNRDTSEAPAPMHFDPNEINATADSRREHLTFLSVTRTTDRANRWPSGFRSGKPEPYQVAVAQAKVFNTHSWDAWTPTWYATLEPVTDWEAWMDRIGDASSHERVDSALIDFAEDYFDRTQGLAEVMLRH